MSKKFFNKFIYFVFITALLTNISFAAEKKHLIVLHTNDIHGMVFPVFDKKFGPKGEKLGGLANIATKITQIRSEYPNKTMLLDAGDISQGTPVSNLFFGSPVTDYMNYIRYDASTFGNHEFDWAIDKMKAQVARRHFPMVCANILDKATGKIPSFMIPYTVLKRNGMNIGIIGVATPDTPYMCFPKNVEEFRFTDPSAAINKYRAELEKKGINIIGVISHNGYEEDQALSKKIKGIDFIIGGHSHTAVAQPLMHNGAIIAQAGSWAKNLGFLKLFIDTKTGKVLAFKGELIPIVSKDIPEDKIILKKLQAYQDKVQGIMSEVIGTLSADADNKIVKGTGSTPVGDLITDIMRHQAEADVVFYNTHGLRASMTKGNITKESVFMVLPFDNNIVTYTLSGADLLKAIEYYTDRPDYSQMSGVTLDYDNTKPAGHRTGNVLVNGKEVDLNKKYRIASIDFLVNVSSDFEPVKNAKDLETGKNVRDEVEAYIVTHPQVNVPEGVRIRVINGDPSPEGKSKH